MLVIQYTILVLHARLQQQVHYEETLRSFNRGYQQLVGERVILELQLVVYILLQELPLQRIRIVVDVKQGETRPAASCLSSCRG